MKKIFKKLKRLFEPWAYIVSFDDIKYVVKKVKRSEYNGPATVLGKGSAEEYRRLCQERFEEKSSGLKRFQRS